MKKNVFLIIMVLVAFAARAYDFSIPSNGYSLYFTILDANKKTAMVVCPNASGTNPYKDEMQPVGVLTIPSTVSYNNETYSVTAIGERAFSGCSEITSVIIPSSVTSIGSYAFYQCVGISTPLVIGEKIKTIGKSAFFSCVSLPEVVFNAIECTQMGGASTSTTVFGNCSNLAKLTIGPLVNVIPDYAFCSADNIKSSLVLPRGLQKIGDFAFAYCTSLEGTLVIPEEVKSIGECAFHQCHGFTSLSLPQGIVSIGQRAFYQCFGFTSITVAAATPPAITATTFANISANTPFVIPCMSQNLYKKAPVWGIITNYQTMGDCDFTVVATMTNEDAGEVLGSSHYGYMDTATLLVVCHKGYGFNGWTDGNNDNPRRVVVNKNMRFEAQMVPTKILYVHDTLYRTDTIYRDGVKIIHDTIDLMDIDQTVASSPVFEMDREHDRINVLLKDDKARRVDVFNEMGDCVYSGKGRHNHIDIHRFPMGTYYVKLFTNNRVVRARFFLNAKKK